MDQSFKDYISFIVIIFSRLNQKLWVFTESVELMNSYIAEFVIIMVKSI